MRANKTNGKGKTVHLSENFPRDSVDATHTLVGEAIEGGAREVEISRARASATPVGQDDVGERLAVV